MIDSTAFPLQHFDRSGLADAGVLGLIHELGAAEVRERERIARGLHDEIGQLLAMAVMKVSELRATPAPARAGLIDDLGELLNQAVSATRNATFELSCPLLELGLQAALESLAQRVSRAGALEVRVQGVLPGLHLPEATLAMLFRIVRELLSNVQKHAQAQRVWIELDHRAWRLTLSVRDDGIGFEPARVTPCVTRNGGYGLWSARAQIEALGGQLCLSASPGAGTTAVLTLPLNATS